MFDDRLSMLNEEHDTDFLNTVERYVNIPHVISN